MKIGVELRSGRIGGWSRPMRRKRNEKKENFQVAPEKLGKIIDWSKIILIIFLQSQIFSVFLPSLFVANDTYEVVVCHADHTQF
jgi:hypothetical protein